MQEFAQWDSFYLIVGGATGALIGLQFVVMTLIAERPPLRAAEAGAAFSTPNIVHFSVALLLSALVRIPWHTTSVVTALWGLIGVGGMLYCIRVARHIRRQTVYRPELEDWLFHVALPIVAYAALAASALTAYSYLHESMFGIGAAALLLLFIGIHNAWDAITYHVLVRLPDETSKQRGDRRRGNDVR